MKKISLSDETEKKIPETEKTVSAPALGSDAEEEKNAVKVTPLSKDMGTWTNEELDALFDKDIEI